MMQITPANYLVAILREASRVERSHTMPHHGSYTNGQHSFDMAMLLLALYPDASPNLVKAVLVHDLPERYTGDMPSPAKSADGELGKRMAQLEHRVMRKLNIDFALTEDERCWLHGIDKAEAFLWAKDQIALGNQNAAAMIGNLASWFKNNSVPQPLREFLETHQWVRTPDEIPK